MITSIYTHSQRSIIDIIHQTIVKNFVYKLGGVVLNCIFIKIKEILLSSCALFIGLSYIIFFSPILIMHKANTRIADGYSREYLLLLYGLLRNMMMIAKYYSLILVTGNSESITMWSYGFKFTGAYSRLVRWIWI